VRHTFTAPVGALGAVREQRHHGSRRFLVDFSGGPLDAYANRPEALQVHVVTKGGKTIRSFLTPNPQLPGIRAIIDLKGINGETIFMEASLRTGETPLTETWSYRWKVE
jgi:glucans biosynthesis protein